MDWIKVSQATNSSAVDSSAFTLTEEEAAFFSVPMKRQHTENTSVVHKHPKLRKTYLIPANLVEEIDAYCAENEVKKTDVVARALDEFLIKYYR